jgi:hypothetical protein
MKLIAYSRQNWFWPLAAVLLAFAFFISRLAPTSIPQGWELAVIFDMLITLPLLFFFCFRKQLSGKALLLRIVALQCLGIWLATRLVPAESQQILPALAWLRYAGLVVLIFIEVKVMFAVFKMVFKANTNEQQIEDMGVPPLLAKLMLMEACFWKWVLGLFRR